MMAFIQNGVFVTWIRMESSHAHSKVRLEKGPIHVDRAGVEGVLPSSHHCRLQTGHARSSLCFTVYPHARPIFPTITTFINHKKTAH